MRKTIRKKDNYIISREIIYIGVIFIIFTAIGTYLNKIFTNGQDIVLDSINSLDTYYSQGSTIDIGAVMFLGGIVLSTLFVVTFPLAIISFLLKGLSIGYTINSCILLMKLKSIKMILLMVIKNFIIIPGAILLIVISLYYIRNIYEEYKKGRREGILFLSKRFLLNGIIIIIICAFLQLLLNAVSTGILQFLVR